MAIKVRDMYLALRFNVISYLTVGRIYPLHQGFAVSKVLNSVMATYQIADQMIRSSQELVRQGKKSPQVFHAELQTLLNSSLGVTISDPLNPHMFPAEFYAGLLTLLSTGEAADTGYTHKDLEWLIPGITEYLGEVEDHVHVRFEGGDAGAANPETRNVEDAPSVVREQSGLEVGHSSTDEGSSEQSFEPTDSDNGIEASEVTGEAAGSRLDGSAYQVATYRNRDDLSSSEDEHHEAVGDSSRRLDDLLLQEADDPSERGS